MNRHGAKLPRVELLVKQGELTRQERIRFNHLALSKQRQLTDRWTDPIVESMLCWRTIARHTGGIVWLTLVVSLVITGNLVVDLAFEEPNLSTSVDAVPTAEEPDNPAENILMASQKTDGPAGIAWSAWAWVAFAAILISACLPTISTTGAARSHERPPRSSPVPVLLPLRI